MSRPPQQRAVITGIGIVSASGIGRAAFEAGLRSGRSPVRELTLFDTSRFHAKHAAWIEDWTPTEWIAPHRVKRMDRCTQFAVVAAKLAIEDAKIALNASTPNARAGVSFGTALGGFPHGEHWHQRWMQGEELPPSTGLQIFPGSAQGNLSIEFGLRGAGTTNANTCAAGNVALGDALRFIQHGTLDVVIAGAAECPISPMVFAAFDRMGAMSATKGLAPDSQYRPFHRDRDGFVMGEGSAMFVIESLAHAEARGATIIAELLGFGATNEAFHMSTPEGSGESLQEAMRLALAEARRTPADIDYLNPHASGTPANDANELKQIRAAFGAHATSVAISGTKPFTGHTLGAAGAIEVATCALAIQRGWMPPTLNLDAIDDACAGLNIIHGEGRPQPVRHALTNSFGFGGIDTSLVLGAV